MGAPRSLKLSRLLGLTFVLSLLCAWADSIPPESLRQLEKAFEAQKEITSQARRRLSLKRLARDAEQLYQAHAEAPERFQVLEILFQTRRQLVSLDDSPRNRKALLDAARALAQAPDTFAPARLEADLLVNQAALARQGADAKARLQALRPMLARYRDTKAEARMIRVALLMALEVGDRSLIRELRDTISQRFAGDLDMISFQRDKLGGQIFGAPFCGTFRRSDGTTAHYPADGLGLSTGLYFWSAQDGGLDDLRRFAEAWHEKKEELPGRVKIVSLNLDGLPDAGESILRDLDLPWPALHLPDGVQSPYYRAFARRHPALVTLSPTGNAALFMAGATRKLSGTTSAQRDYTRWFGSTMARSWSRPRYLKQLASLLAGDFFLRHPAAPFDPDRTPELGSGGDSHEGQTAAAVPAATLQEIQNCFIPPPQRYRLETTEIIQHYRRAESLSLAAIASHPDASNLWIVYNRLLVARMGLWKVTGDSSYFREAVSDATKALTLKAPRGGDLLPRFCLARQALRQPDATAAKVIETFLASEFPDQIKGQAYAAAALLALDAGERALHEKYRALIIAHHLDDPMMWTFGAFLVNRYHRYQIFRAPFVSGRSFGYRQDYFLAHPDPDAPPRSLPESSLPRLTGGFLKLPDDVKGKWTALLIHGQAVEEKRAPLFRDLSYLLNYLETRPRKDLQVLVALTTEDLDRTRQFLAENPLPCPVVALPGGTQHPLVQKLAILSEDETSNLALLNPKGELVALATGLTMQTKARGKFLRNLMEGRDEAAVLAALAENEVAEARELAFTLAPPVDVSTEQGGKGKTKTPEHSLPHLRARARVHLALGDFPAALADANEVVRRQTANDAAMSFRTKDLDQAEAFRDLVKRDSQGGHDKCRENDAKSTAGSLPID